VRIDLTTIGLRNVAKKGGGVLQPISGVVEEKGFKKLHRPIMSVQGDLSKIAN
jgi:hypothetical protein